MQCLILAGGLGTRIRHIAPDIPKALIPVNGIPFLDHQLRLLVDQKIDDIVMLVGHKADQIVDYVGDGSKWDIAVRCLDEGSEPLGTGGAIRFAVDQGCVDEHFFILYGDSYLPIDYPGVWQAFQSRRPEALMSVFRNERQWDTSNVHYSDGMVTLYDKHNVDGRADEFEFLDYGVSVLSRESIKSNIPNDRPNDLADYYYSLSKQGKLAGHEVFQRFYEVGSPTGLTDLEEWLSRRP